MTTLQVPETVGLCSKRLDRINQITASYVDSGRIAGTSTLVARKGKIVHQKCYGLRSIEDGLPIEQDTIFRIYSMTKPITSAAIMILYERGLLRLDSPVSNFIPEFSNLKVFDGGTIDDYKTRQTERDMTIVDLLKHTSGLSYAFSPSSVVDDLYVRENIGFTDNFGAIASEQIRKLSEIPLLFSPGTAWNYSISTDVLGYIIEVISGKPLQDFFRRELFEPLGMYDTDFYVPEEKINRLASSYFSRGADALLNRDDLNERLSGKKIILGEDPSLKIRAVPPTIYSGGGGLLSTVSDYYKFCNMMINKGKSGKESILSPKTVELMTSNQLPTEMSLFSSKVHVRDNDLRNGIAKPGLGFGLGFAVVTSLPRLNIIGSVGEYSWSGGANTTFLIDPKEDLVMIFMTQLVAGRTYPIHAQLRVALYQSLID